VIWWQQLIAEVWLNNSFLRNEKYRVIVSWMRDYRNEFTNIKDVFVTA
jgi:hypothetical protein